jgi:hypothetical protein
MIFEPQALAPGPGIGMQAMTFFRAAAISNRFERFMGISCFHLWLRS